MNRVSMTAIGGAIIVLALSALTGCGSSNDAAEANGGSESDSDGAVEMSIALNPWVGYGPWYVAKAKGFDLDNGVDLKFVDFVDNKDLYAAVASERIDSTEALVSTSFRFQASEIPLKVALFQDISTDADAILGGEGIDSVADLRGEKVAFDEGGGHEMLLRLALEQEGMTLDDIESVPMSPDKAGSALISGQVKAAVTYQPYISHALELTEGSSVISTAGEFRGIISDVWLISDAFAEAHPETVQGALAAWNEGVEYFRTNQDEALQILAEATDSDAEELAETYQGVELFNAKESLEYFKSEFPKLADQTLTIMKAQGSIDGEVDAATLVDVSHLEEMQ